MADGIDVTAGTGTTILTDETGSGHAQVVKLAIATDGSATLIPADGTAGLLVNLGSNNDVTVTGTVDLGATDNAVLDAIAASVAAIDTDATTIIGHLDGVEALLGTIDADTSGIITAVQLLDDAVYTDDADFTDGTSVGYGIMGVAENTPTTVTDGDMGMVGIDPATRAMKVTVVDASVTVDGTVDLGATDNAVLDAIAASVAAIDTDATTIIGHLDGVEGILTTMDADTGGILTAVQIMDDWDESDRAKVNLIVGQAGIAGGTGTDGATVPRVTLATNVALPAGTNNIGDVDILSIVPGTGATNLGKAEDAGHNTGDVGVMALGVRAASPTERSAGPTDGDYEPFATNEVGAMWTSSAASANGGATTMNATSSDGGTALTNSAQAIKASAGCLYGYYIYNPNATAQFVQFYNTASGSVTVGTTNPLFMLTIPATSAANLYGEPGMAFGTAMSWAATSTAGGNGAPGTALDAVAWYK